MWEDQGCILGSLHTLSIGAQDQGCETEAIPAQTTAKSGHEPRHLGVVLESSKEETGEFDKHLVIAVQGDMMHVWRVVVCPDDMGCPKVFQTQRLPTYQLPRPAISIATLDPLDHS